jgi:predicted enzyme related to lactoylglutathione lyase
MNRPVHFEILAEDPAELGDFYHQVLGWDVANWPGGGQTYWMINTGSAEEPGINGGLMAKEFPQAVINTIEVPDLEKVLEGVRTRGGRVVHGPNEVPGVGLHAYCADPEGILFGLLQSTPPIGSSQPIEREIGDAGSS